MAYACIKRDPKTGKIIVRQGGDNSGNRKNQRQKSSKRAD